MVKPAVVKKWMRAADSWLFSKIFVSPVMAMSMEGAMITA